MSGRSRRGPGERRRAVVLVALVRRRPRRQDLAHSTRCGWPAKAVAAAEIVKKGGALPVGQAGIQVGPLRSRRGVSGKHQVAAAAVRRAAPERRRGSAGSPAARLPGVQAAARTPPQPESASADHGLHAPHLVVLVQEDGCSSRAAAATEQLRSSGSRPGRAARRVDREVGIGAVVEQGSTSGPAGARHRRGAPGRGRSLRQARPARPRGALACSRSPPTRCRAIRSSAGLGCGTPCRRLTRDRAAARRSWPRRGRASRARRRSSLSGRIGSCVEQDRVSSDAPAHAQSESAACTSTAPVGLGSRASRRAARQRRLRRRGTHPRCRGHGTTIRRGDPTQSSGWIVRI